MRLLAQSGAPRQGTILVTGARFPLPLRNALAELTIAALDDAGAAAALAWLADRSRRPDDGVAERLAAVHLIDAGEASLLRVHAPHGDAVAAHARRALRAADAYRALHRPAAPRPEAAVRQAAALWAEHLFFEVHEVLEAVWKTAGGDLRQALQGLIQIAVAFHHHAHENLRGARSLLAEGRARLAAVPAGTVVADTDALLAATAPIETALQSGAPPKIGPPNLVIRS
jgi:hypothetical protein